MAAPAARHIAAELADRLAAAGTAGVLVLWGASMEQDGGGERVDRMGVRCLPSADPALAGASASLPPGCLPLRFGRACVPRQLEYDGRLGRWLDAEEATAANLEIALCCAA